MSETIETSPACEESAPGQRHFVVMTSRTRRGKVRLVVLHAGEPFDTRQEADAYATRFTDFGTGETLHVVSLMEER